MANAWQALFDKLKEIRENLEKRTRGVAGIAEPMSRLPLAQPVSGRPTTDVTDFASGGQLLIANSSNVAAMQYHPLDRKLMIEYLGKNGKPNSVYLYSDVSPYEAETFARAGSSGKWCWTNIRVRGKGNSHLTRKSFVRLR